MELSDYSKIHQLYHREVHRMKGHPVVIQEKIDGSQISFSMKNGELFVRSKNRMVDIDNPDNMFGCAVAVIKTKNLPEDYVFRGEYLKTPKHNILTYNRIPNDHIIIYDIECDDGSNHYLHYSEVIAMSQEHGFEVVPMFSAAGCLFEDIDQDLIDGLMKNQSILGGQLIEGLVIKCYDIFDSRDKTLMCKYVRPEFKEMSGGKRGKSRRDIIEEIGERLAVPARFEKAVQHLRDDGLLIDEPKDIGILMKELNRDFEEHVDEIKNLLYANFRKDIIRVANRGFAEYYKAKLQEDADYDEAIDHHINGPKGVIEKMMSNLRFYVKRSSYNPGKSFLCRGPHDDSNKQKPTIHILISSHGAADEICKRLNDGELEFSVGSVSVQYNKGKLEITNEQKNQSEKD